MHAETCNNQSYEMRHRLHDEPSSPQDTVEEQHSKIQEYHTRVARRRQQPLSPQEAPNRTQRPRREKPHAEAVVDFGRMELGHVFTVTTRWSLNSPRFPSTDVHMFYLWIWNTVKTTYNKNKENI